MSDRRSHHLFLYDISLALDKILEFSSGISFEELSHDEIRKDAILRNIQVLGDAAKNLPPDFVEAHPEIDCKGIAGLRDVITHQYFRVDWAKPRANSCTPHVYGGNAGSPCTWMILKC